MSLATRCPACSTTFRVVQDQLKVSDGWVRCGQCQEVFNALETLFELPATPVAPAAAPQGATRQSARPTPDSFTDIDLGEPPPPPHAAAAGLSGSAVDPAQAPGGFPPADSPGPDDVRVDSEDGPRDAPVEATGDSTADPVAPTDNADSQASPAAKAVAAWAQSTSDAASLDSGAAPEDEARMDETSAEHLESRAPATAADEPSARDDADASNSQQPDALPLPSAPTEDSPLHITAAEKEYAAEPTAPEPDAVGAAAESGAPAWTMSPETRWERKRSRRARASALPSPIPSPDATTGADPAATATRMRRRKPEFMRRVERAAHWQRPAVRAVLGSATAALLLLLCGQVGLAFRDDLAARWPVLADPLAQACRTLGCEVAAPRSLEHLVIDSSQLSRTAWPDTLRLTAELRNTASHAVRAPALELRFTDPSGRTLVRKVLLPAELAASAASAPLAIGADDSWHVDALLAVGPLKVSGFSAEVFYP